MTRWGADGRAAMALGGETGGAKVLRPADLLNTIQVQVVYRWF